MKNTILYSMIVLFYFGCSNTQPEYIVIKQTNNKPEKQQENQKDIISIKSKKIVKNQIIPHIENNNTTVIDENKIVLLYSSSKIGKYALDVTNTVNTYLMYKNIDFSLDIYDLDKVSIDNIYQITQDDNINKVIAVITKENINILDIFKNSDTRIYLPLINKENISKDIVIENKNILFGGISYGKQFNMLLNYSNNQISELYGKSYIGYTLHNYLKNKNLKYSKVLKDKRPNYRLLLKNKNLDNTSLILNTPIVKSSIVLSQLRALKVRTKSILSTQINYTPLLFSLTQRKDRKNIIIANSIGYIPDDLIEYNNIIGNTLLYSWVNYTTIVGIEYLLERNLNQYNDLYIKSNQINYNIDLYVVNRYSFTKLD